MISMIHAGLGAEKLAILHEQQKMDDAQDSQQKFHLNLLLNAIVVVSLFNGT